MFEGTVRLVNLGKKLLKTVAIIKEVLIQERKTRVLLVVNKQSL